MDVYEMLGDNGEVIGFFKGKVEPEFFLNRPKCGR